MPQPHSIDLLKVCRPRYQREKVTNLVKKVTRYFYNQVAISIVPLCV